MSDVWVYTLVSVFLVSLVSFAGVFTLGIKAEALKKFLIYMLAFSAGALLGDAFFHLIPELSVSGLSFTNSAFILFGIVLFFSVEKFIHWQHCHMPITEKHVHPFAYMNLVGDAVHNFLDGMIIAVSYLVSIPLGMATSVAVILHEIPQEIGDFGVLLHGGFSKNKALLLNFASALIALAGAVLAIILADSIAGFQQALVAIAIGGFIYIASADLIPELHKETLFGRSFMQLLAFVLGMVMMALLLLIE